MRGCFSARKVRLCGKMSEGGIHVGAKCNKILAALVAVFCFLSLSLLGLGEAAYEPIFDMKKTLEEASKEALQEERLNRPAGSVLSYPGQRASFAVTDPEIGEIFRENSEYRVRLLKPGKVVVYAVFPRGEGELPLVRRLQCEVTGGRSQGDDTAAGGYARQVLELCNAERKKAGLTSLQLDEELAGYAEIRAEEATRKFSHVRPNGKYCSSIMPFSYFARFRQYGENLAGGQLTPEQAMEGWMNSPGHRANILNPRYKLLGVAYVYRPDSRYRHYWVQQFGTR